MEIVMRKVSELTPYEKNAKQHDQKQIDNVANSIRRFGWQQPIVVDENGVVVIGHCRLLAAKKLKLKEVPVTVASGLTDEEIRELRIADNKTNESPWDLGLLEAELPDLDFEGFEFDFYTDTTPEEISGLIEVLLDDEKAMSLTKTQKDYFNLTFSFSQECKDLFDRYIKENGRQKLIDLVFNEMIENAH